MLVLTRKLGEDIVIADDIVVTVLEWDRTRVKLGVTAPKHIGIYRKELIENQECNPTRYDCPVVNGALYANGMVKK